MSLSAFLEQLEQLATEGREAFSKAVDQDAVEKARVKYLGAKKGLLKEVQKQLGKVPAEAKREAGQRFNQLKQDLQGALEKAAESLKGDGEAPANTKGAPPGLPDITLPGRRLRLGRLHPITQTIEELKDIMGRLGFSVADGPEIEDEWHNFEALNIPESHPARDPLENFYLGTAQVGQKDLLLRSQTSTVQIRVMEQQPPPVRIISLGRVYRPDTADATHYPMFHQIEALLVDKQVTMADLKSVLRLFARSYFGGDVHIRFRPSFFPFTEPSVEVDMSWGDRWIEMGGAGMVDPHVLSSVGYDPEEVTGFAFGLGVERICARRHGVRDIREFYRNDLRFLRQF